MKTMFNWKSTYDFNTQTCKDEIGFRKEHGTGDATAAMRLLYERSLELWSIIIKRIKALSITKKYVTE